MNQEERDSLQALIDTAEVTYLRHMNFADGDQLKTVESDIHEYVDTLLAAKDAEIADCMRVLEIQSTTETLTKELIDRQKRFIEDQAQEIARLRAGKHLISDDEAREIIESIRRDLESGK